jgi:predicted  nucleic acid-binding Zn-ribbon protein
MGNNYSCNIVANQTLYRFLGDIQVLIDVRKNRGKTAIAKIDGEFCGECNMKLRPQVINEARLKENVVICESCQRILYTE